MSADDKRLVEAVARIVAEAPPLPAGAVALLRSTGLRPLEVAR